jgi:NAD(P)H-hydrate epimerase
MAAFATVTFAALKPGLVLEPGRSLAGVVEVADIGLPTPSATHLLVEDDVRDAWPARLVASHKWRAATWVVAGSPGMLGAAHLASRAAMRAGAGMVRLSSPGVTVDPQQPVEVVGRPLGADDWAPAVLGELQRFHSVVVGPGLGRGDSTANAVRHLVAGAERPLVVDGDGLAALSGYLDLVAGREAPTVLTPHDGEYSALCGAPPGPDRIAAAHALASRAGAVVLLKGPTTVVAAASGETLLVTEGDARLATAGTGDVLSGVIGALLAQGVEPMLAAAAGAWVHGAAAKLGPARGLVAGDLIELLPAVLAAW